MQFTLYIYRKNAVKNLINRCIFFGGTKHKKYFTKINMETITFFKHSKNFKTLIEEPWFHITNISKNREK